MYDCKLNICGVLTIRRVWDCELDWLCRSTLTGHKDDVHGLSAIPALGLGGPLTSLHVHDAAFNTEADPGVAKGMVCAGDGSQPAVHGVSQEKGAQGQGTSGQGEEGSGGALAPGPAGRGAMMASASADSSIRLWYVEGFYDEMNRQC